MVLLVENPLKEKEKIHPVILERNNQQKYIQNGRQHNTLKSMGTVKGDLTKKFIVIHAYLKKQI